MHLPVIDGEDEKLVAFAKRRFRHSGEHTDVLRAQVAVRLLPPRSNIIDQSDRVLPGLSWDTDGFNSAMPLGGVSGQRLDQLETKRGFPLSSGSC